jgi:hypothetical protein
VYPGRSKELNFLTSFSLMSTFKYVCAVFLRINDLNIENRKVMGWILVVLDVVFMIGVGCGLCLGDTDTVVIGDSVSCVRYM